MGWFHEQIQQRRETEEELFEDALIRLAGSVMGRRIAAALQDDRQIAKDALDEILRFYHVRTRDVPDHIRDAEEQMEYLFRPYGIMRRPVTLEKGWTRDAVGAMLGTWKKDGSLVTLLPGKTGGYRYYDRQTGACRRIRPADEEMFDTEALCFYKPFPLQSLSGKALWQYLRECVSVSDGAVLAVISFVALLLGMLTPKLNYIIFSGIVTDGSLQTVLAMAVFLLCAAFSGQLILAVKNLWMARMRTKMHLSVEAAVMMRLLSLPADFFKKYGAGELASRAQYVGELCETMVSCVLDVGLASLFSLGYLVQIFAYAPALVVPVVCVLVVLILTAMATAFVQARWSREEMETASRENGMSYALITGVRKIRLSGAEKRAFARWAGLYAQEAKLRYAPPLLLRLHEVINLAVSLFGVIVLQYAAWKSGVSAASYYAFYAAYGMVSGAFLSLASVARTAAEMKPVAEMVQPILAETPEIDGEKQVVTKLFGGIELNNVSFRYHDHMPWILDDFSLKIRSGQYVAIVGASGCGKSTLMRLMLGFERPQRGAVYYDGKDLERLDLKSLRRKIGVVMQQGKLFAGDIYSNIAISAPQLTIEEAWEAAEMAGMADDIRSMPMGMNTLIDEGNGGISGGQRQRLMIARAIAPKPRILMFDEATSALDNITQKIVSDSLSKMKCTRIVIAHRLSTVMECDRIVVLDKGKIVEDGSYEALMEKNGVFRELMERQRVDQGEKQA